MINDLDGALSFLADRVEYNTRNTRQDQLQRRNQVVDIYGEEFTRQGDSQTPARFYVSISPDMVYLERFEFKLIVQPFSMSVGNNGATANTSLTASTSVGNTSLSGSVSGTTATITPNPHSHTATTAITPNPHNHALTAGITLTQSTVSNFRVSMGGIDLTPYLQLQYPGWITGEGIFPNGQTTDNYDLLTVAGLVPAWQRGIITSPGYKDITISANGVYSVSLALYLKYSHVNR